MGEVKAVCISREKGTRKENVCRAVLRENHGLVGDAHAGNWHRQVSLLSAERIEAFRRRGADVAYGDFGENLVVEGLDFKTFPIGSRFRCGDVVLKLTQIGKECHNGCAIFQTMGDCIMPREGVFCEVEHGGLIQTGDEFCVIGGDEDEEQNEKVMDDGSGSRYGCGIDSLCRRNEK